jgi:tetratricopeptide (TPR) repeat protein
VFVADSSSALFAAEAKLAKALSSVPDHARGHMLLGYVQILTKRAPRSIAECEHALALERNLAQARAYIGFGKIYTGRPEETEAHIVEALRLSPRDTMAYHWMTMAGIAKNHLGLYDQAVPWFRRAIEANRNHPHPHFVLGVALALLGRLDEARSSVKAGLALNPTFTIARARAAWSAMSDDTIHLAQLERLLDGMRSAGVPEQ